MEPLAVKGHDGLRWLEDGAYPLDWNGPSTRVFREFRSDGLALPILVHLERLVGLYPNRIAVTDSETSVTYAELWDRLSGLAAGISSETKPGDLIAILLPTCSAFPVAMLACLAAGRTFVALDPQCPESWLNQVIEDARPALIIKETRLHQSAPQGWRPADFGVDEPACVVFTSGSTGRPKGIVNSQRNLLQRVAQSINAAHINPDDRFLTLASICTIVGLRDTLTALLAGASIHLLDPQRLGAREILTVVREEAITILFAFPALLRSVIAYAGERADATLRLVRVGGDTTLWSDIDLLRGWLVPGSAIQSIYAATEAPMMQWFIDSSCRADDPRIPIGYPLPGNRLALMDEHGHTAQPGEAGELIVESPYVALGHWVDGHCVNGSMDTNGACRLFRTGDLVRQRPDGLLERMGRKDRQIKIRGARVDLDGVEAVLRQNPFVRDVAVLARTTGSEGQVTLVAYVSARDGAPATLNDELKVLMRSSPSSMRPSRFYMCDAIPRLPSSKLDLRALTAMDEVTVRNEYPIAVAAGEIDSLHSDYIARTVEQVWRNLLHTPVQSIDDDFFEAGGDSLKAITFMMELERALGIELSLTLINEAPNFGRLCQALREHHTAGYMPLVPLKTGAGLPPVFFIHGVGGSVAGLFPTARRMTYPGEVIGIQARGLAGEEPPHASVEAMAAEYLKEIKLHQPYGPYYLCGYSFGGLVAFEMARRLSESGDEVAMVGLFDTLMSPLRWPLHAWFSIVRRRIRVFVRDVGRVPIYVWPSSLWKMATRAYGKLRDYAAPSQPDGQTIPDFLKSAPASVLKVAASALTASARYRPGFYPGKLTFFTPAAREPGLPSIQTIWSKHARDLSIVEVAGTHSTMLSPPHADSAAASLTSCLPVF